MSERIQERIQETAKIAQKVDANYIRYTIQMFAKRTGIDFVRLQFHYYDNERPKFKNADNWLDE